MVKKISLSLFFLVFVSGAVFPDNETEENILPKNTVTVDLGLTFSTLVAWAILEDTFFGTALQYERQISESASVAGRLEYRGVCISSYDSKTSMASFSAEGHGRYYPARDSFFLDGMLGYANFRYSAEADEHANSILHYFKFGAKLGWRIDFGKPGGFIVEPSFGYYHAIGKTYIEFIDVDNVIDSLFNQWLNIMYHFIIKGYFVGGPQLSVCVGYRF